jgi:NAD(P)-dependent dehydrogenase (short-subunit alcohol dehydrogenase family)
MAEGAEFPEGTALVAGGSGGIGAAVCARLAQGGAHVALTYRTNEAAAADVARAVRAHGREVEVGRVALEDLEGLGAFVRRAEERLGPIHTVVYAAGSDIPMRFVHDVAPSEWRKVVDADVHGFYHLVHATLPRLRESKGSLVAITSVGLERYPARDILSVAPKAAISALVRGVAAEEGRFGVRANSVAIGVIEAGIFLRLTGGDLDAAWVEAAKRNTALKRFGTKEEVADAVAFLASRRASYVTGHTLVLDGGYSI